ncbi:MAG: flagellar basal body rod modification protein [Comamonadaceae bacterium]|jgi:flagellar basal-body rod modification protein FlgD|uniref:Basal-body rod modification protein FlgD n=1 Tax=Hydrogenophaga borbori TaxID=2294117 RepID=A0A372EHP9_9BURK|nr:MULTISPECIES: flagellar hook capping FlgD N-terminal domain-containing protein [Hydrogenophaga]NCT97801.1 flagellar basal body rod modification protein [Comamonadaceae bacterium]RFP78021.1 flagellar basal body rod modification protein [Hydrogenophaga borbori]WQB82993.1 flagellar hook capping FlgD N-terminal domain-containing protein [Hydrogenophaga sp. SNF1]
MLDTTMNTGAAGGAAAAGDGVAKNGMSVPQDMFIRLLVAQVRNQDPLEPKDPSEFVSQLATLSQTEALQTLVSQNNGTAAMLDSLQVLSLGGQVGHTVAVRTSRIDIAGNSISGSFTLDASSQTTAVVLTAADGRKHRVELGPRAAGTVDFRIDPAALGLPEGRYSIAVDAGEGVPAPGVDVRGVLSGIRLSPTGGVQMNVSGIGEVTPAEITGFFGRETASSNG